MEALSIGYWADILEVRAENESNYYNEVSRLERIDRHMQDQGRDYSEVDVLMAWAACRVMLERKADAINVLNKVIALSPGFAMGLTEKALLLASSGEWDQALDTAQRALDVDQQNFDALKVRNPRLSVLMRKELMTTSDSLCNVVDGIYGLLLY